MQRHRRQCCRRLTAAQAASDAERASATPPRCPLACTCIARRPCSSTQGRQELQVHAVVSAARQVRCGDLMACRGGRSGTPMDRRQVERWCTQLGSCTASGTTIPKSYLRPRRSDLWTRLHPTCAESDPRFGCFRPQCWPRGLPEEQFTHTRSSWRTVQSLKALSSGGRPIGSQAVGRQVRSLFRRVVSVMAVRERRCSLAPG